MRLAWLNLSTLCLLALAGCTSFAIDARSGGSVATTADEAAPRPTAPQRLGIPPGHIPPPGQCRVWHPGTPPGHQPRPGSCSVAERQVGPGDWLLYRPTEERKIVKVSVYDDRRPGTRVSVRVYDYDSGRLLRAQ
jgi:hypothetical protein